MSNSVEFVTAGGHRINYQLQGVLTCSDINWLANWYCENHPDKLPSHVWLHPSLYKDFAATMSKGSVAFENGQPCLMVTTGAGILLVKPVPYSFDKFLMLLGTQDDFNHYFLDEVFEAEVLKDCERE